MIVDGPRIGITASRMPEMMNEDTTPDNSRRNPRAGSLLSDSVAALLSSSVFATVFYPLHRVKILLQTQDSNPLITSGQVHRYRVMTAVPRLVREGGVRELWRGNGAYMLRHVPSTTLSFAFKDALLRALPHYEGYEDLGKAALVNLAAGFIGGAAALFFVYPLDFVTIRMAAELRHSKKRLGVMDTLNSTQRSGGLAALYRGFGVSAAAIGAYKALYFGLYDTACAAMEQASFRAEMRSGWAAVTTATATGAATGAATAATATGATATGATASGSGFAMRPHVTTHPWATAAGRGSGALSASKTPSLPHSSSTVTPAVVRHQQPHHGPTVLERWAAANLVVVTASTLTYPLDVVRKRLVADTALEAGRQQYKGFLDCVTKMARTEGLRGFYRFYGYDMMLRLGGGVLLVLYDELKTRGPASVAHQMLSLLPRSGQEQQQQQLGQQHQERQQR